jgi:hypothetical protein
MRFGKKKSKTDEGDGSLSGASTTLQEAKGGGASPAAAVEGLNRVTRHPLFWALGFVGLGAAAGTPFFAEAVMWCGPAAIALVSTFRKHSGDI